MENKAAIQVITLSGACCQPHLARADQVLAKTISEAIGQAGVAVEVRQVSLSNVLAGSAGLTPRQQASIVALFNRYGVACAPAVLVGDEIKFAGKQPTVEQLKDAFLTAAAADA